MSTRFCPSCESAWSDSTKQCPNCGGATVFRGDEAEELASIKSVSHGQHSVSVEEGSSLTQPQLGTTNSLLEAIAKFLKALWLLALGAVVGSLGYSQISNRNEAFLKCSENPYNYCTQYDPGVLQSFYGLISFVIFVFALIAGFSAISLLKKSKGNV